MSKHCKNTLYTHKDQVASAVDFERWSNVRQCADNGETPDQEDAVRMDSMVQNPGVSCHARRHDVRWSLVLNWLHECLSRDCCRTSSERMDVLGIQVDV